MNIARELLFLPYLVVFVISKINNQNTNPILNNPKNNAVDCAVRFYETHTQSDNTSTGSLINVILLSSEYVDFQNSFIRILNDSYEKYSNSTIIIQTSASKFNEDFSIISKTSKCILFISRVQDIEEHILSCHFTSLWNPRARIFVIFHSPVERNRAEIRRMFDVLHKHELWQSFIIVITIENGATSIITWCSKQNNTCDAKDGRIIELEQCSSNGTMRYHNSSNTQLKFRQKTQFKKLNGCQLKISARVFPPFVMEVNRTKSNQRIQIFSGAEIFLVQLIASKLNMTLEVYPNRIPSLNPAINTSQINKEGPIYTG